MSSSQSFTGCAASKGFWGNTLHDLTVLPKHQPIMLKSVEEPCSAMPYFNTACRLMDSADVMDKAQNRQELTAAVPCTSKEWKDEAEPMTEPRQR